MQEEVFRVIFNAFYDETSNIVADAHDEYKMCSRYEGDVADSIECASSVLQSTVRCFEDQVADTNSIPLALVYGLILQYARFGEIVLKDSDYTDEYIDALYEIMPCIDECVGSDSTEVKFQALTQMMCFLWKYIKELLDKFSSQQGSSSQQGNTSQQGSSLNITPDGVKAVLDALKQGSQGIASKAPENASNCKGTAKVSSANLTGTANAIASELQKEINERAAADETLVKIQGVEMNSTHKGRDLNVERKLTVTEADKRVYKELMSADMLRYARALYNQLRDVLQDIMEGDSRKGLLFGHKFVGSDAHRLDGKRFCNDKDPLDFPDMAICVLIDQSGSMCGVRMQSSMLRKAL